MKLRYETFEEMKRDAVKEGAEYMGMVVDTIMFVKEAENNILLCVKYWNFTCSFNDKGAVHELHKGKQGENRDYIVVWNTNYGNYNTNPAKTIDEIRDALEKRLYSDFIKIGMGRIFNPFDMLEL